ncbi:adenine nucleotide alpha hydrolase [Bosea sp. (in: a-proteobacteria)]|uniref:adenine nucleotide alpha hydrolase n=1 Tax=Bosea sp. (in: a-proteobacteria) TaxID=1871050 RepID=UPI002604C233|nr:adenine nucleotide alpha hydrolase [Bosea sp. (in: a-proteobacteria)]MCO5090376.1 adenine nucleotide alpha hydrolase [Bosea sp. (in: a-proteobacteria)]
MTNAERLLEALDQRGRIAIALSGGVDSMTLATVAHRRARTPPALFHAVSPAVPAAATALVRRFAAGEGWDLTVLDAREFDDPAYRANPVNRCYFCKTNLYGRIRSVTALTIASGTNLDDLGDFRPGLKAADEHGVIHPFVIAGIAKAQIRELARHEGLGDVAELPAQPCLSSRVETGIAIDAKDLAFIEATEAALSALVERRATLRCRLRREGVTIEVEDVPEQHLPAMEALARRRCLEAGRSFAGLRPYRKSSAFIR